MPIHLHTLLRQQARHSEWANARLYDACSALDDISYRSPPGPASVHGLLNRLLVADRMILAWLSGYDPGITSLDEELHGSCARLMDALVAEDVSLVERVRRLDDSSLFQPVSYSDLDGNRHTNSQLELIITLLEQQARLRGAIAERLTELGRAVSELGFIAYLREGG